MSDELDSEALTIIDEAVRRIEEEGGFAEFIQNAGFGGIALAFFINIIEGINSFGGAVMAIVLAPVEGAVSILDATFGGFIDMIEASTGFAVESLWSGSATVLGPFQPLLVIVIIMIGVWLILEFLERINFSPIGIFLERFRR